MPHKHKRKRDEDLSTYDLPPISRAKPIPVHKKQDSIFTSDIERKRKLEARKQKKNQTSRNEYKDDTPKAFQRLMAFQQGGKRRSGLDDGTASSKKKATRQGKGKVREGSVSAPGIATHQSTSPPPASPSSAPKIKPGESLSLFSQRVDQSLPLTSIPKHNTRPSTTTTTTTTTTPGLEKLNPPLTKHNKKLARMQKDWREQDRRAREKKDEEDEARAEKREEEELAWLSAGLDPKNPLSLSRGKRRRKGAGVRAGKEDMDDADPWKVLEKKRREEGEVRQRNLQDVVQGPPVLKSLKNMFRVKNDRQVGVSRALMT